MSSKRFRRTLSSAAILLGTFAAVASWAADSDTPKWTLELEAGPFWQSRNDVQIPNDETGTRFSLQDLVGSGPWFGPRLQISYTVKGRHGIQLYLAPLSYTETGQFETPVLFAGNSFSADTPTQAKYQFNSWRASYRYQVVRGTRWLVWVGFTGKIRDAEIELRQGETVARDTDTGFVPLFLFEADCRLIDRWHFLIDLDALAGGPGRAEDLALKIGYDLSNSWRLTGGYRTIEGGADVDEVYNFAWFHSAVVSAVYRF
jgi:hypothetical protein